MKKIFLLIFSIVFIFTSTVFAMEPPIQPTELTQESVDQYNKQVEDYNNFVDEYNLSIDQQYENALTQYNDDLAYNESEELKELQVNEYNQQQDERVNAINQQRQEQAALLQEEAIKHNEEEDQKVAENQQALEEQAKIEERIEQFKERGLSSSASDLEELPVDWTETSTSEETKTIKVEQTDIPSDETYNVMNIHFYLNENAGDEINNDVNFDENDNPVFSEDLKNNFVLAEWETITANKNDTVTTISESEAMGYRSAAFYRYMEGYTNGYWMPDYTIFMSSAMDSQSIWYKGVAQEFSYANGTTDNQEIKNALSLYTYSFYRLGDEPTKVEEYVPDYWETNIPIEYEQPNYITYAPTYKTVVEPTKKEYLTKRNFLTYVAPQPIEQPTTEQETIPEEDPPIIETPIIEEEPTIPVIEEPIEPQPIKEETPEIIRTEPETPIVVEEPVYPTIPVYSEPTPLITIELVDIEDLDTPLAGGIQLYDFRGIPVQYSPRESGIYKGSNKGMTPTGGYLLKVDKNTTYDFLKR